MKILICCPSYNKPYASACGNVITVERIRSHLEKFGIECETVDPVMVYKTDSLCENIEGVIAIHAWHCYDILKDCPLPFIIIFGGTDLNEFSRTPLYLEKMSSVVHKARFLVTFGPTSTMKCKELFPCLKEEKLKEILQAVTTNPSSFSLKMFLKDHMNIMARFIFLLVAGIRNVKDPLFVIQAFSKWHTSHRDAWLVIIGPKRDEEYYFKVKNAVQTGAGIVLLPEMPRPDIHSAMRESVAVINSSVSESMSSAILEAMDLGTPVIARNIPGNRDLIEDYKTGLLFTTCDEFVDAIETILIDETLRKEISQNAKHEILKKHSVNHESVLYSDLVLQMLGKL